MKICHVCWAEQHGWSADEVRQPGEVNRRCTEHMRTMPLRFECEICGHPITNTAGSAGSMGEAIEMLAELMEFLTSDAGEEDRRQIEDNGGRIEMGGETVHVEPIERVERAEILCHGCWHQAHPEARGDRDASDEGVCAYHGYQEMIPEGVYHCGECDRGMILLHEQSVSFIRNRFDLPQDTRISRDNPGHEEIREFMVDYAKMQARTRRN